METLVTSSSLSEAVKILSPSTEFIQIIRRDLSIDRLHQSSVAFDRICETGSDFHLSEFAFLIQVMATVSYKPQLSY
jgi:hypothetical protein